LKLFSLFSPKQWLAVLLIPLVSGFVSSTAASARAQQAPAEDLKIVIIEGDGFINNIRQRTARDPVVEVRDRNNRPVAGALVTFTLPESGPGGTFSNALRTITLPTNSSGRVTGLGFSPNQVAGSFRVDIEARFEGQTARASYTQQNERRSGWRSAKRLILLGAAIAIAITAIVLATRGSKTSVQVGAPTVGPR
jgi:hypothetical protein